jgi:hypothetical protein
MHAPHAAATQYVSRRAASGRAFQGPPCQPSQSWRSGSVSAMKAAPVGTSLLASTRMGGEQHAPISVTPLSSYTPTTSLARQRGTLRGRQAGKLQSTRCDTESMFMQCTVARVRLLRTWTPM